MNTKYVAYYERLGGSIVNLNTAEIDPSLGNIFEQAGRTWLERNVVASDPHGHDTAEAAIADGSAKIDAYWNNRLSEEPPTHTVTIY